MYTVLTRLVSLEVQPYQEEMDNTRLCLDTLAYCGAADPVASRFLVKAQCIHNSVLEHIEKYTEAFGVSGEKPAAGEDTCVGGEPTGVGVFDTTLQSANTLANDDDPSGIPASFQHSVEELSYDLLELICRPFGDPSQREGSKESLAATHRSDPSRYEHSVLIVSSQES